MDSRILIAKKRGFKGKPLLNQAFIFAYPIKHLQLYLRQAVNTAWPPYVFEYFGECPVTLQKVL